MLEQYLQVLLAFLFVIGLIALLSFFLKKLSFTSFTLHKGKEAKQSLSIIDILPIDNRRKLVLIKSGNKKHLLLLGSNSDVVVESIIDD